MNAAHTRSRIGARLNPGQNARALLSTSGVLLGMVVLFVFFSLGTPFFFNFENVVNIGRQIAVLAIAAFAMTFVILAGEIDLSMGSVASLAGVITAMTLRDGTLAGNTVLVPTGFLAGLGVGLLVGAINGFISVRFRVPSFIVTLGVASIAQAITRTITDNRSVSIADAGFRALFAQSSVVGISITIFYTVIVFAGLLFLLTRTPFGTGVYAVGGNMNAARLSGIPAMGVKIGVFLLAGLLVGFAGVLQAARLGTGVVEPIATLELDAIAAVVLGGTSFSGGRGSLPRTVLGVLLIGILNNGLALMNVDSYYQMVIKGAIVIIAVLLDRVATASPRRTPERVAGGASFEKQKRSS